MFLFLCSFILSVISDVLPFSEEEQQLQRLMARNDFTEVEARDRISSQMPLKDKIRMSTHERCLIDNSGSVEVTRAQVIKLKQYLDDSWRPEMIRAALVLVPLLFVGFTMSVIAHQL